MWVGVHTCVCMYVLNCHMEVVSSSGLWTGKFESQWPNQSSNHQSIKQYVLVKYLNCANIAAGITLIKYKFAFALPLLRKLQWIQISVGSRHTDGISGEPIFICSHSLNVAPPCLSAKRPHSLRSESLSGHASPAIPQGTLAWGESVSYTHLTLPTTGIRCRSRWSPYH